MFRDPNVYVFLFCGHVSERSHPHLYLQLRIIFQGCSRFLRSFWQLWNSFHDPDDGDARGIRDDLFYGSHIFRLHTFFTTSCV